MNDAVGYLQVPQQHSTVHQYLSQSSTSADTASPAAADTYSNTHKHTVTARVYTKTIVMDHMKNSKLFIQR